MWLLNARPETAAAAQAMVLPLRSRVGQRVDLLLRPAEALRLISRVMWPTTNAAGFSRPADTVALWLKPSGFFDRNPALDLAQ
jgi:hypothetical protein